MVIGRGRRREHPQPTFCTTTKKKSREKDGHAQNILSDRAYSGHVTSGSHVTDVTSGHVISGYVTSASTPTNDNLSAPIYYSSWV